jgi:hypothetical protein
LLHKSFYEHKEDSMNRLFYSKLFLKIGIVIMMMLLLTIPLLAYEGSEAALNRNISSGAVLRLDQKEVFSPNGSYYVSIEKRGKWIPVGEIQADKFLRKRSVDLTRWVKNGGIRVLIEEKGGGAAHIDSVAVNGLAPSNLDDVLIKKLSRRDNDVVDAFGKTFELSFENIQASRRSRALLELIARIEPERIGQTPFQFPLENMYKDMSEESSFYTYRIGSHNGTLTPDGELSQENLGQPFFSEFFPSGSGHPDAKTYGWVRDDGKNLYVAIDFLGDNTVDGEKDYTKVYVNTPGGLREFKVNETHKLWGTPGFTYTERVGWQHKVYEYVIPLNEICSSVKNGQPLQLAFAAYGTLIPPPQLTHNSPSDPNGVDPDSGASGTTFTFSVTYADEINNSAPNVSQVWIDLDGDSVMDTSKSPLVSFPPTDFTGALLLLIPASLLIVFLILRKRMRLVKQGVAFAVTALVAVAAITFTGCPAPPANTTQEVYNMTWANSDETEDWFAGEDFSADVQIYASPGDYTFRFVFKDSTGTEVTNGSAAGDLTLTIE